MANKYQFVQPQVIERGNVSPVLVPRLAGDGEETNTTSSTPVETSQSSHLSNHRVSRPVFMDGQNRNSTDIALRERQRQKDVTLSAGSKLLPNGEIVMSGYTPANALFVPELSKLQEWKDTVARQEKELEKLQKMMGQIEKERSRLQDDKLQLQSELGLQTTVNKDLKKLLVASMGADLHEQLESASSERAQLAQDLENTVATLVQERETLERVKIQCDVWRSKFLGSRLQVDEVVSSRTRLDMLVQETFYAMQKLLEERSEMRNHMMKTYSKLHYLSNALQRSHSLNEDNKPPSNVITLGLLNEQLSSTISHQLLGNVDKDVSKPMSVFEFIDWTQGEMLAKDLLLNKQPSYKVEQLHKPQAAPTVQQEHVVHRYHPTTKYENLTINCCNYCTGDLLVV
ncbi:golgin-45-like [Amphiura filiformis]|uniref:golgin-45-like n=1 Tax=Amphiura filiformis TaxID=82378 RepID=UPI003B2162F1